MTEALAYLGVCAVVICTPGPDTALTIRNSIISGRRGGVLTAAGIASGQLVWTVAASVGIAGLNLHIFSYVTDIGYSPLIAASFMSTIALTQLGSTWCGAYSPTGSI